MKRIFTAAAVLALGFLAGGLMGCFTLLGLASPPKEIVYTEIPYSELDQSIANVNTQGQGFIVEAYYFMDEDAMIYIADKPMSGNIMSIPTDMNIREFHTHHTHNINANQG
jgi:hypothetical protein